MKYVRKISELKHKIVVGQREVEFVEVVKPQREIHIGQNVEEIK